MLTRLRSGLRTPETADPQKRDRMEEAETRRLRNGKSLPTPARKSVESERSAQHEVGSAPSHCAGASTSAAASHSLSTSPGLGSCAICWRDFGDECSLEDSAVVKDEALVGRKTEEAHMFCVGCIAEVCWQHHMARHRALSEGVAPPAGPVCPKCRAPFTHVLLHRNNDLGIDSSSIYGAFPPPPQPPADPYATLAAAAAAFGAPSGGGAAAAAAPARHVPDPAAMHTHEVSTRHLMCTIGPRRRKAEPSRGIPSRGHGDPLSHSSALFAMLGSSI